MKTQGTLGLVVALISAASMSVVLGSCGGGAAPLPDDLGLDMPYPGFKGGAVQGEKNFANLINNYAEVKSPRTPWAGNWWPYKSNGIAAGVDGGSPAGKYDAARGGTTHAESWEARNHGSQVPKLEAGWWGHCNGWTAAAALIPEPRQSVRVNGITFTVADQKGLLSEVGMGANADFFGTRVDWPNQYNTAAWWDVVPDQYFLILTNYLGRLSQNVLFDRFTGREVWNQPVAAYRFNYPTPADYLGADPSNPNVYRILLTSKIFWVSDNVPYGVLSNPFDWENSPADQYDSRVLTMEVWVDKPIVFDSSGKVVSSGDVIMTRDGDFFVGGAWKGESGFEDHAHPDYMWVPSSIPDPDPADREPYSNPYVAMSWINAHILSGGVDDPSVTPIHVPDPPSPRPVPSGNPLNPGDDNPIPFPTFTPIPFPTSQPPVSPVIPPNPQPQPPQPQPHPTRQLN